MIFIDLHKFIEAKKVIKKCGIEDHKCVTVYLYGIGGFPITHDEHKFSLLGTVLTDNSLIKIINDGLGLSGLITYLNSSKLETTSLGEKCRELKHTWAYNWMTLSFWINDPTGEIEKSFTRSSKFFTTWCVSKDIKGFGVSGSIKNFMKFSKNHNDKSFDKNTRLALTKLNEEFSKIWK